MLIALFIRLLHRLPVAERPQLILDAEAQLGIVAGLQDRVIQVLCYKTLLIKPAAHECRVTFAQCWHSLGLPSAALCS